MHADRPGRVQPCDQTARRDRGDHEADGDGRGEHEPAVRDDGCDEHRDEERQCDERGAPMAPAELERGAHDDGRRGCRRGERREPEQRPRCPVGPHADSASRSLRRRS